MLSMFRGDTKKWRLTVTLDSVAKDITTADIYFTAREKPSSTTVVFQKAVASGIEITDGVGGIATITLAPSDTSGLAPEIKRLSYDVQLNDGDEVHTIDSGTLTVNPDITTDIA